MDTLDTTYGSLRSAIAFARGFGADSSAWDSRTSTALDSFLKLGQQRFFFQALVPGTSKVHEWSFLKSSFRFGAIAGQLEYDLPEDFGSVDGPIVSDDPAIGYPCVRWVNEGMRDYEAGIDPAATGFPQIASVLSIRSRGVVPQRWRLSLWPSPDAAYGLRMRYNIAPDVLTATFASAAGGAPHARTLELACMAEAFRRLDNAPVYEADYQSALAASISYDCRNKGDNLGYNGDPSTEQVWGHRGSLGSRPASNYGVTMEGVQY